MEGGTREQVAPKSSHLNVVDEGKTDGRKSSNQPSVVAESMSKLKVSRGKNTTDLSHESSVPNNY